MQYCRCARALSLDPWAHLQYFLAIQQLWWQKIFVYRSLFHVGLGFQCRRLPIPQSCAVCQKGQKGSSPRNIAITQWHQRSGFMGEGRNFARLVYMYLKSHSDELELEDTDRCPLLVFSICVWNRYKVWKLQPTFKAWHASSSSSASLWIQVLCR